MRAAGRLQCWIEFAEQWQWQLYMSVVAVTLFAVPALVIAACYVVIVATIWRQGRTLQPPQKGSSFFASHDIFQQKISTWF
jgi:hypothetical protein